MNSADSITPFEDLKSKLVSSYALTDWQRVNKILHHPALGDRRPTALMDAMLALLPDNEVPGKIFLGLFLERLPTEMREHLVTQDFKNPNDMALHADKLWDARKVNQDSFSASATITSPALNRDRDRRSSSPACHSQTPGPSSDMCFYHEKFGSLAEKCRAPCNFPGNARAGGRRRN